MNSRMLLFVLALVAVLGLLSAASGPASVTGQIAYLGNGKVYLVNSDGTAPRPLISGLRVDNWGDLSWSPNGKQIAFTVGDHNDGEHYGDTLQIYVAAADGTKARRLTGTAYGAFDPTWSPDGTRIAFTISNAGDRPRIAVIGADGTHLRMLASPPASSNAYWVPDWSPDGAWILFDSHQSEGGLTKLMAIHPDGTGLHQVAVINTGNHCACADWSPDGTRIAFQAGTRPASDRPEIYVMNADGSGRIRLTQNVVRDENPDWSPDGKQIAFYSERRGNAEIYVIGANGGPARRITHDPWYSDAPAWRPAG